LCNKTLSKIERRIWEKSTTNLGRKQRASLEMPAASKRRACRYRAARARLQKAGYYFATFRAQLKVGPIFLFSKETWQTGV